MRFGSVPIEEAHGAILAHGVDTGKQRFRKGTLLDETILATLKIAGVDSVIAAIPDADDILENEAAQQVANALRLTGCRLTAASTGRVNIHAERDGLLMIDREIVNRANRVDPAITLATLPDMKHVIAGQMVATVKIIPFAVNKRVIKVARSVLADRTVIEIKAFSNWKIGLVQTRLPSVKTSVLDKTVKLTAGRLARSGSRIVKEIRTGHSIDDVSNALHSLAGQCEMIIVFGASAVSDFDDVIPAAIRSAGGHVERVGMPVDPGNLLVMGKLGYIPVLGAPGCARSPKENGFDWILDRLLAGLPVSSDIISGMGVGGLLTEIRSRPQPRDMPEAHSSPIDGVMLAAGLSSRMGKENKLLAQFRGESLVRLCARAALESGVLRSLTVVAGHQSDKITAELEGLDLQIVKNPDYREGLSSSLKTGVASRRFQDGSVMVLLGDMPGIGPDEIRTLSRAHDGQAVVRATHANKAGNPVIIPEVLLSKIALLEGDTGAKHMIDTSGVPVIDVDLGSVALLDLDTPAALESFKIMLDQH